MSKSLERVLLLAALVWFVFAIYNKAYEKGYEKGLGSFLPSRVRPTLTPTLSPTTKPTTRPTSTPKPTKRATPRPTKTPSQKISVSWGGPELWEAVNKRRIEFGVNPLSSKSELCTIASIRLNELLELGKLDGHEGFGNMVTRRPDLKWIFDRYNLSEFLVSGATTPEHAVSLWENTLGHKKLLNGGEYVWGCIYAQAGFGVAITAY